MNAARNLWNCVAPSLDLVFLVWTIYDHATANADCTLKRLHAFACATSGCPDSRTSAHPSFVSAANAQLIKFACLCFYGNQK